MEIVKTESGFVDWKATYWRTLESDSASDSEKARAALGLATAGLPRNSVDEGEEYNDWAVSPFTRVAQVYAQLAQADALNRIADGRAAESERDAPQLGLAKLR